MGAIDEVAIDETAAKEEIHEITTDRIIDGPKKEDGLVPDRAMDVVTIVMVVVMTGIGATTGIVMHQGAARDLSAIGMIGTTTIEVIVGAILAMIVIEMIVAAVVLTTEQWMTIDLTAPREVAAGPPAPQADP